MEQRIEVDNGRIIEHLTQQVAQQALRIAILESHIATMNAERDGAEPGPVTDEAPVEA